MNDETRETATDHFLSALGFITVLPSGKNHLYSPAGMSPYFPLVGFILGLLLCGFDFIAGHLWPPVVVAVLDVIFMMVITGAFHLDGLADTADGIFSHRSREKALEIMKDSRIGTMGLLAVVCGLSIKCAGIYSLAGSGMGRSLVLVLVPAYARSSLLFGIRFLPYGRSQGTGKGHFDKGLSARSFGWMLLPVILSAGLGLGAFYLNVVFVFVVWGLVTFYKRKMGCITGDMLGAMVEVCESLLFLAMAAECSLGLLG